MSSLAHANKDLSVECLSGWRQWLCFVLFCVSVFGISLYFEYRSYQFYTESKQPQEILAQVVAQYAKSKNGRDFYQVLKLKTSDGAVFFTTSNEEIRDLSHRFVRIYGKIPPCSFMQYLRNCFVNTYRLSLLPQRDYRDKFRYWVDSQHASSSVSGLYKSLFIADFLRKEWRDLSNKLGIAHIIAISGFHLGILSLVIGGVLKLLYSGFHRYVSYRNQVYDIGFITLVCLFGYLVVLDFSPSFLRAFMMVLIGFLVLYSGVRLLSFQLLFVIVSLCLALFPRLIFSVGFILSVSGVFFIYLFIQHFHPILQKAYWQKYFILPFCFNGVIFIDMLIVVHCFFPYFTPLTLISIPLTLVFILFFPLVIALHFVGLGGIFDGFFEWVSGIEIPIIEFYSPWWLLGIVVCLSAVAMWRIWAYWILNLVGLGFFGFLCWKFYKSGLSLW